MARPLHPYPVEYLTNPSQEQLRSLTLAHTPAVAETSSGNLVKVSRNKARQAKYTYIIDTPDNAARYSHQLMHPDQAADWIAKQEAYILEQGKLIEVQGFLGLGPRAVPVQWLYTVEGANIAGMQSILRFPVDAVLDDPASFSPRFRVVYTPNFFPKGLPGDQAIIVDLKTYTTYIMGPDYFGESKKAALRMLNDHAFRQGGLVLHAGAKLVHVGGRDISMTIMGLSGTGKTTTTFSKQGTVTQPIQDDMVTIWPKGELSITENGCFAKTWGLSLETEPVIYKGTLSSDAWVENVYFDENGDYDFVKEVLSPEEVARMKEILLLTGAPEDHVEQYISGEVDPASVLDENGEPLDGWDFVKWTGNGRSIIPMSSVEDAADLHNLPDVHSMGILNRDEGDDAAMPGILRFTSPEQAAGFFMLGETSKTSAAGKDRGKTRSPFTQPFFPLSFGLQAQRFSELAATMPHVDMWLMNTGFVGGDAKSVKEGEGFKVKIRHSSAMLEAMLTDAITWTRDPDFGYEVVDVDAPENAALLDKVPAAILNPARWYAEQGKEDEYRAWVQRMKAERRAFLEKFEVDEAIITATCG